MTAVSTEVKAEAEKTHEERFRWRGYVHVPASAETCEHATDGKCKEEDHFHALIRLPNPYQQQDIVEKAQAARARRLRMLRDEDSDARIVLEDQLYALKGVPLDIIADELVDKTFAEDYMDAVREVESRPDPDYVPEDDEEIPALYANIDQDREEYARVKDLPEDKRPEDFEQLESAVAEYSKDVQAELERIQKPKSEHFMSLGEDELIDMVRRERINQQGTAAYLQAYQAWQAYTCTYRCGVKGDGVRIWTDINQMRNEADTDIVLGVKVAFDALEAQLAKTREGKDS